MRAASREAVFAFCDIICKYSLLCTYNNDSWTQVFSDGGIYKDLTGRWDENNLLSGVEHDS